MPNATMLANTTHSTLKETTSDEFVLLNDFSRIELPRLIGEQGVSDIELAAQLSISQHVDMIVKARAGELVRVRLVDEFSPFTFLVAYVGASIGSMLASERSPHALKHAEMTDDDYQV
jgi:hypothetical protein